MIKLTKYPLGRKKKKKKKKEKEKSWGPMVFRYPKIPTLNNRKVSNK